MDLTDTTLDYARTIGKMFAHREAIFQTPTPCGTPRLMTEPVDGTQANLEADED